MEFLGMILLVHTIFIYALQSARNFASLFGVGA